MYDRFSPIKDDWFRADPLTVDAKTFEEQMNYFSQNYDILSLSDLVRHLSEGKSLPEKAVVITIDNGNRDSYLHAYPALRRYHAPATIFLCTDCIGSGRYFWEDRVAYGIQHANTRQLELNGFGRYIIGSGPSRSRV
jgi:peptidoglycan/xylan/chitin deacetylase (PgdA/CDA1 family)